MRTPLIAGNWKMHGSKALVSELVTSIVEQSASVNGVNFALMPPFIYLPMVASLLDQSEIAYGAQTVSSESDGAFTGEISVSMLNDWGCRYVIVGHSERRQLYGETNEIVAAKFVQAVKGGLVPILCVGETLEQRESGKTDVIIEEQLAEVLRLKDNLPASFAMVVAYEPIWAIGTGHAASPEQAQHQHQMIRKLLDQADKELGQRTQILYGGSVKPNNAASFFEMTDIDGALVGGASLDANSFIEIGKKWNK